MTDEIKLNADIARAAQAEALLRNELLQDAFTGLEMQFMDAWRLTQVRDTDARERLWQAVNVVGKVQDALRVHVNNGKLAQRQLEAIANNTSIRNAGL
ncbi:MAG TPA: hypothetical protein VK148_29660 [Xanthobacteraceae bacterium]|jgi:hypothetical protein|nr:hypothetical protein [Xanthobacteraceae bacterium]